MDVLRKTLSSNDVGTTGGHQSGIHIQKSDAQHPLLPALNPNIKNPDATLACVDERGEKHDLRFVYYNNKLHDEGGTRDEYRITCVMDYLQEVGAKEGDTFVLTHESGSGHYNIAIISG
ncbi:EcoRII N-terminal effector-binding domain-containing protein [Pseudomonas monteilii]|uniref:EcoRII N-terminal effector-binding domain-containing protein n=1 Tax=Pseudomonas monteilii TaxID=76759 RepID=UPI00383A7110